MCKPAIKWVPEHWSARHHGVRTPYDVDPDLWMFHMKFGDRDHLEEAADHRHHQITTEGRAKTTSWGAFGDDMVALLDEITTDLDRDRSRPSR